MIDLVSWGAQYGTPPGGEAEFDLTVLPPPPPPIASGTGLDEGVQRYYFSDPVVQQWGATMACLGLELDRNHESPLMVFICKEGRHRSVAMAEYVGELLRLVGVQYSIRHLCLGGGVEQ